MCLSPQVKHDRTDLRGDFQGKCLLLYSNKSRSFLFEKLMVVLLTLAALAANVLLNQYKPV